MTTALAPGIVQLLRETRIAPDGRSAEVRQRTLNGDTPYALRALLAEEFYRCHHVGHTGEPELPRRPSRDPDFEQRLLAVMPHRHTSRVVPLLAPVETATATVVLDGVRVALPAERVASVGGDGRSARVRLDAARAALSPGFFLCDGSRERRLRSTGMLRVYVHVADPESAPAVWGAVLAALEDESIPYRAKVCSSRTAYPRQDGLVVYLGAEGWYAAERVTERVLGLPGVGGSTSAFVCELAPGVGAAWEPEDRRPGMGKVSFGEHRAAALARGLLLHHEKPDVYTVEQAVCEAFLEAGIDPAGPARNIDSPRGVLPETAPSRPATASSC
ncbi:T3SS effector HopA1 family protein [Streptomyces sp. NPDC004752]